LRDRKNTPNIVTPSDATPNDDESSVRRGSPTSRTTGRPEIPQAAARLSVQTLPAMLHPIRQILQSASP